MVVVLADKVWVVYAVSMLVEMIGMVRVELCVVVERRVEKVVNERSISVLEAERRVVVQVDETVTKPVFAGRVVETVDVICGTPAYEHAACKIYELAGCFWRCLDHEMSMLDMKFLMDLDSGKKFNIPHIQPSLCKRKHT